MALTKKQRADLYAMFDGRCAYCGCKLPEKGWHADHIEPVLREWWKKRVKKYWKMVDGKPTLVKETQKVGMLKPQNDVFENFFPSCQSCKPR